MVLTELLKGDLKALSGRLPSAVLRDFQAGALSSTSPASKLYLALHLLWSTPGIWWELGDGREEKEKQ